MRAIASDVPVPGAGLPVIALDDVAAIADAALALAEPVAAVVAALDGTPPPARLRIGARP